MAEPSPLTGPDAIAAVTTDAFLDGRLIVKQPATGYRAGLDAVLLASTVISRTGAVPRRLADLGAGVGTVGLCAASRNPDLQVVLVEREPELASLAAANIAANHLGGRVRAVTLDLEQAGIAEFDAEALEADTFDVVVANPPFYREGSGRAPPDRLRAASHVMPAGGIERWARVMARLVAPSGQAAVIHRADALSEILAAFEGRFGDVAVLPVYARQGEAAGRVVVAGRKGSRAPLRLLSGLETHADEGHGFTPTLQAILRDGAGLDLWAPSAPLLVPPGERA